MNEREFHASLHQAYDLFKQLGVAAAFTNSSSLAVNADFNQVALDTEEPYPAVYFAGLRFGQYNFQLQDFSYFQFSYGSDVDLRYAFYPSPFGNKELQRFSLLERLLQSGEIDDEAYYSFVEDVPCNYRRPLLRYEYSVEQYKMGVHPVSHLHIGTYGDDRWVFHRRLTPLAFALKVAKLYFRPHWEAVTVEDQDQSRTNEFDEMLERERGRCSLTPADMFAVEGRSFHFA